MQRERSLAQTIFSEGAGCLILPTLGTYILAIYNKAEFTPMKYRTINAIPSVYSAKQLSYEMCCEKRLHSYINLGDTLYSTLL